MDEYRAVYLPVEGPIGDRLQRFYSGEVGDDDPLASLLDQRGEVDVWGFPHFTLLDALTTAHPDEFKLAVEATCREFPAPVIKPADLAILSQTALVVRCVSPVFDRLRQALIEQTRALIARTPITDEEIQRTVWWIQHASDAPDEHLTQLHDALAQYRAAGWPSVPNSRHFRLGFLMRLTKALGQPGDRAEKESQLHHFLSFGEPPWYAAAGSLHLTIASGLSRDTALGDIRSAVWESIAADFRRYEPHRVAIMGENREDQRTVRFFDWLTEKGVEESRSSFQSIASYPLSPPALLVRKPAVKRDPALQPGKRGQRKVVVTEPYKNERLATEVEWASPAEGENCPVQLMNNGEVAVFNQHAAQDRHYHKKGTEIYMVIEGEMLIEVDGSEYVLLEGDMIVVNPNAIHEVKPCDREFLCRVVTLNCGGAEDKFTDDTTY